MQQDITYQIFWHHGRRSSQPLKNVILALYCWIMLSQSQVRSEVFSSASDMKNIFRMEMDLANSLSTYAKKMQAKLDRIDGYIQVLVFKTQVGVTKSTTVKNS